MLAFGHAGLTLAAAALLDGALVKSNRRLTRITHSSGQPPTLRKMPRQNESYGGIALWFVNLARQMDVRLLLLGSLLPDFIDKPIVAILPRDVFGTSRVFCHTLLFLTLVTLVGLYLHWSHRKTWLLVLSFGTFTHLIFDQMWLIRQTLLWPSYGFSFESADLYTYVTYRLTVYIAEFVGGAILIWFVWLLVSKGKLYTLVRSGRV